MTPEHERISDSVPYVPGSRQILLIHPQIYYYLCSTAGDNALFIKRSNYTESQVYTLKNANNTSILTIVQIKTTGLCLDSGSQKVSEAFSGSQGANE